MTIRNCVACDEEIKTAAIICKHCGVRQDDQGFIRERELLTMGASSREELNQRVDQTSRSNNESTNDSLHHGFLCTRCRAQFLLTDHERKISVCNSCLWSLPSNLLRHVDAGEELARCSACEELFVLAFGHECSNTPQKHVVGEDRNDKVPPGSNQWGLPGLILGICSVFFPFVLPIPISAVVLSVLGLIRAFELKTLGTSKTQFGISLAGLILGVVYFMLGVFLISSQTW